MLLLFETTESIEHNPRLQIRLRAGCRMLKNRPGNTLKKKSRAHLEARAPVDHTYPSGSRSSFYFISGKEEEQLCSYS